MSKIQHIVSKEYVDFETGEVRQKEETVIKKLPSEPSYVKLYIDDIGKLYDLPVGPRNILYLLIQRMDYEGFITLSPNMRKRIAETAGFSNVRSLNNALVELCKSEILKNTGRGEYEVNPHLFAKGEWRDIRKRRDNFKLTVEYKNGKRVVKGNHIDEPTQTDLEEIL